MAKFKSGDVTHDVHNLAFVCEDVIGSHGNAKPFGDGHLCLAPVCVFVPAFAVGSLVDGYEGIALGLVLAHMEFVDTGDFLFDFFLVRFTEKFLFDFNDGERFVYFDRFRACGDAELAVGLVKHGFDFGLVDDDVSVFHCVLLLWRVLFVAFIVSGSSQ